MKRGLSREGHVLSLPPQMRLHEFLGACSPKHGAKTLHLKIKGEESGEEPFSLSVSRVRSLGGNSQLEGQMNSAVCHVPLAVGGFARALAGHRQTTQKQSRY